MYIKPVLSLCVVVIAISGCENHDPLPASECPAIVKHSQSILKKLSKPTPDMMKACREMTDEQRGCVKNATIVHDLYECSK